MSSLQHRRAHGQSIPAAEHEQAVDRLAPPLQAVQWSPDGVVEAIEHPDHPFAVGVTWHPELLALTQGSSALAPLIGLI